VKVESGEPPLERRGDGDVARAEGEQRGHEFVERGEVVGLEQLALDDAEVELDLIEPARVHRGVDDADLRPALAQTASRREVFRAQIVALAADGLRNDEIAERLGTVRTTVSRWRKRFFEDREAGLADRPRSGRPRMRGPRCELPLSTTQKTPWGSETPIRARIHRYDRPMWPLLYLVARALVRILIRARQPDHDDGAKDLEILVLRHQLRVLQRTAGRPQLRTIDRVLLAAASRAIPRDRWVAFLVTPAALLRFDPRDVHRRDLLGGLIHEYHGLVA
jgi:Winged helix-turn helix